MREEDFKCCFTCKQFAYFHGSAGICREKDPNQCCCDAMVDGGDVCDKYEPKNEKVTQC